MQSIIIMHVHCMHALILSLLAILILLFFHTVCPETPSGTVTEPQSGGSSTIHTVTAFLTALGLTGVAMLFYWSWESLWTCITFIVIIVMQKLHAIEIFEFVKQLYSYCTNNNYNFVSISCCSGLVTFFLFFFYISYFTMQSLQPWKFNVVSLLYSYSMIAHMHTALQATL